jgi:hypothetical protein
MRRRCQEGQGECPACLDIKEQYERQLADLQLAYGEAMLELRDRNKQASLLGNEDGK